MNDSATLTAINRQMTDALPHDDADCESLTWWYYALAPLRWSAEFGQLVLGQRSKMPVATGCWGIMAATTLVTAIAIVLFNTT